MAVRIILQSKHSDQNRLVLKGACTNWCVEDSNDGRLARFSPVELRSQQSDPNRKWGYTTTVVPGYAVVESLKDFRVPILKLGVERPRLKQKTLNPTWGIEAPSVPARRV